MIAVRLEPQMEAELANLASATGRSKSYYVKEALTASARPCRLLIGSCRIGAAGTAYPSY